MGSGRELLIVVACTAVTTVVSAQNWVGRQLTATQSVKLYQSLPTGLYCSDGPLLASIARSEKVKVLSQTRVNCALVIGKDFIEVERLGSNVPEDQKRGYIKRPSSAGFVGVPRDN